MTAFNFKIAKARIAAYKAKETKLILGLKLKQTSKVISKLEKDFAAPNKEFLRNCDYSDFIETKFNLTENQAYFFLDIMIHGVTQGGNEIYHYIRKKSIKKYPEYWI